MKALSIIAGILLILGGFFCMLYPGITFLAAVWIISILLLVAGIMMIVNYFTGKKDGTSSVWDIVGGIVTILLAIIIIFSRFVQFLTDILVVYMFCAALLVGGILAIVGAVKSRKIAGSGWGWRLAFGILMVLLGVASFFTPFADALALGWLIAFMIIFQGVNLIAGGVDKSPNAPST